jgi:regulatory protein
VPRTSGRPPRESFAERRERRAAIDDPAVVLNAAARFLEARSRSVDEVRRHLSQAGYRADLTDAAIARLIELGMLNDETFARMWVESRDRARPRSESALRRELAQKGIGRELSDQVLDERRHPVGSAGVEPAPSGGDVEADEGPDMRAAERLLRKKGSTLTRVADPRERRQRAYALLARNGFDPDVCREASVRFAAGETPADDEA